MSTNKTIACTVTYSENAALRADIVHHFAGTKSLCPIEKWDVSLVRDFSNVFRRTAIDDEDLSAWDVSNAVTFAGMFSFAKNYQGIGIGGWAGKTGGVISMANMFYNAEKFNGDLSGWNVGGVTDFSHMFLNAKSFHPIVLENTSLSEWDVSKGTNFEGMFKGAEMFNDTGLTEWELTNAVDLSYMFHGASMFDVHIEGWSTPNALSMASMFEEASTFNRDLSSWNVSNVNDFDLMFRKAKALKQDYCAWDLPEVATAGRMFFGTNCTDDRDPKHQYCDGTGPFIGPFCSDCNTKCAKKKNSGVEGSPFTYTHQHTSMLSGALAMYLFWF